MASRSPGRPGIELGPVLDEDAGRSRLVPLRRDMEQRDASLSARRDERRIGTQESFERFDISFVDGGERGLSPLRHRLALPLRISAFFGPSLRILRSDAP